MKKFFTGRLPVILLAILLIPAFSFTNATHAQAWSKLGERKVNFKADKDVISGKWDGWFRSLQIKVRGGPISIQKMVVHYRNGQTTDIALRENFADGSSSRVIDLPGTRRLIEKVVFWYDATATTGGNKPVVELWGRH